MISVVGVIQVRMGSSRVPGKAMLNFAGKPLIWHIVDRMRRVNGVSRIIIATSTAPENSVLRTFASDNDVGFYEHDGEDDLAGRIAGAIAGSTETHVLKTGGDCPLVDPFVMQKMVDIAMSESDADFISNRINWSYPLGLSADLISRSAIEWADTNLLLPKDREFFALYIRDHNEQFKVIPCKNDVDLSHHIWTVDEPEDVSFMKRLFSNLYRDGQVFSMNDVLSYLEKNSSK